MEEITRLFKNHFETGKRMTEYTVDFSGKVTVTVHGNDTDANYEEAQKLAVQAALKELDGGWILDTSAVEYTDYEEAVL
jgi:hypothetical protein